MKIHRRFAVICGCFLSLGSAAFGQEKSGNPQPIIVKHTKHKKIIAPLSPIGTPTETPQETKETAPSKKFEVGLYGGIATFRGQNDISSWPTGGMAGVWAGCLMDPRAAVGVRLEYTYFAASPSGFGESGGTTNGLTTGGPDMNVICFVPSLKLNLNPTPDSPVQPYVMIGAGAMNKSMANGGFQVNDSSGSNSVTFIGYSETVPMVSITLGLPIQLPGDYQVPIEAEMETGFTSGQNTNLMALTLGVSRDW